MTDLVQQCERIARELGATYQDLHRHPELSGTEQRTAGIAAAALRDAGFEVMTGIGGHGVVGILRNGPGETVWLRADMDGLPMAEATGLPYASKEYGVDPSGERVPIAHACGHDMHVTCLIGATTVLAATKADWSGTVVAIFQPAEETLEGARGMLDDGLASRVPTPAVVLGQHVAPLPAGIVFYRPGAILAAADDFEIVLHGAGGHASRPETTVDPVVMAASLILRLQTIVSRSLAAADAAVVTVGRVQAGTKDNIIPDFATLNVTVRTFDPGVRTKVVAVLHRMVEAEALAAGAPRDPEVTCTSSCPVTANEPAATARVAEALAEGLGSGRVWESPRPGTGSEDFGLLGAAVGVPSVFWFLGGADPELFAGGGDPVRIIESLPSNHSPDYAPVIEPTLSTGIAALVAAARGWL